MLTSLFHEQLSDVRPNIPGMISITGTRELGLCCSWSGFQADLDRLESVEPAPFMSGRLDSPANKGDVRSLRVSFLL